MQQNRLTASNAREKHKLISARIVFVALICLLLAVGLMLYKRANVIPENFPERFLKVGKGYFEPTFAKGFAFHPNCSDLYTITDSNMLVIWSLQENKRKYIKFPSIHEHQTMQIFDVAGSCLLYGLFDHDSYREYLEVSDIETLKRKHTIPIKGNLAGARFDEDTNIVYAEIVCSSQMGNAINYLSWNKNNCTTKKTEKRVNIDGLKTFYIQTFNIYSKDGSKAIKINNQSLYSEKQKSNDSMIVTCDSVEIDDMFNYPINAGAISAKRGLFFVVSSPTWEVVHPLSRHYTIGPIEQFTSLSGYCFSSGRKLFSETYPFYPSYHAEISNDEKWLAVSIGGYILVYDIASMCSDRNGDESH